MMLDICIGVSVIQECVLLVLHLSASTTCLNNSQQVLNQMNLCHGIADMKFAPVTAHCKGVFTYRAVQLHVGCYQNQVMTYVPVN